MLNREDRQYPGQSIGYSIEFQGQISRRWADWIGEIEITDVIEAGKVTNSTAYVQATDQAALLGTLQKMHNLGCTLLKITQVNRPSPEKGELKYE